MPVATTPVTHEYPGPEDDYFYQHFPKPMRVDRHGQRNRILYEESLVRSFETKLANEKDPKMIEDLQWGIKSVHARISRPGMSVHHRQDLIKFSNLQQHVMPPGSHDHLDMLKEFPLTLCDYDECGETKDQVCGASKSKQHEFCDAHACFSNAGYECFELDRPCPAF